jgi:hypothetical protein
VVTGVAGCKTRYPSGPAGSPIPADAFTREDYLAVRDVVGRVLGRAEQLLG